VPPCRIIIIIWDILSQHDLMNPSLGVKTNGAVQHSRILYLLIRIRLQKFTRKQQI